MKSPGAPYLLAVLLAFSLLLAASRAHATIYTYTDNEGIVHYTNVPANSLFKPVPRSKPAKTIRYEYQYETHIYEAARLYDLDPNIIKAIIKAESNFDRYALSQKGAKGLMQLMPGTALDMKVSNIYDPRENIFGGTRYFKKLFNIFEGDLALALASYNAGLEKVRYSRTVPDIKETKTYIKRVLKNYQDYQNQDYRSEISQY
jgi:soluble lytic murein transglycosylase